MHLRLLISLPAILIPACVLSSLAFRMVYFAYKLNKQAEIYSLDVLLSQLGANLLFHAQFYLLLPDLHIGFSRDKSGGLVFPSLSEFSTVYSDHISGEITPERMKGWSQSKNNTQLWM